MLAVIVIASLCMTLTIGMLELSKKSATTRMITNSNTKNYYEIERAISEAVSWVQYNSKNLVSIFDDAHFASHFDLGPSSVGTNQGTAFPTPNMVKMKGANQAVQLSNNAFFGTSAFPNSNHIDTNVGFNTIQSFNTMNFGNVNIRMLLVWVRTTEGHHQPVFRVDAITGSNPERGVHGINFIRTDLVTSNVGLGFYGTAGLSTQAPNNECFSYKFTYDSGTSKWSPGASRSNCTMLSDGAVSLRAKVWGSVYDNQSSGITLAGAGAISGTKCEAPGCHGQVLPTQIAWATRCTTSQGDFTAGDNSTLATGTTLATQCWRDLVVGANKKVTLTTTDQPYYFRYINIANNGVLKFANALPGTKYLVHTDAFSEGHFNGLQVLATNLAPHQLELNLTTASPLLLNGTATIFGIINTPPGMTVTVNGNFSYYGAIRTGTIDVKGNAVLNYDEFVGGAPVIRDLQFSLFKASQRYR